MTIKITKPRGMSHKLAFKILGAFCELHEKEVKTKSNSLNVDFYLNYYLADTGNAPTPIELERSCI